MRKMFIGLCLLPILLFSAEKYLTDELDMKSKLDKIDKAQYIQACASSKQIKKQHEWCECMYNKTKEQAPNLNPLTKEFISVSQKYGKYCLKKIR